MANYKIKRVMKIGDLNAADHIYIHRKNIPHPRHGIVMSMDYDKESFTMLCFEFHYFSKNEFVEERNGLSQVIDMGVFIVQHESPLENEKVLERARKCIGPTDLSILNNPSRQIALHCKLGIDLGKKTEDDRARNKLTSIDQLSPADHIAFDYDTYGESQMPYSHHAIVTEVFPEQNKYKVIHFQPETKKRKKGRTTVSSLTFRNAVIIEEDQDFDDKKDALGVYLLHHDPHRCLPSDEVISRAKEVVGSKGYNAFNWNCESFANYCKIGKPKSEQVDSLLATNMQIV